MNIDVENVARLRVTENYLVYITNVPGSTVYIVIGLALQMTYTGRIFRIWPPGQDAFIWPSYPCMEILESVIFTE